MSTDKPRASVSKDLLLKVADKLSNLGQATLSEPLYAILNIQVDQKHPDCTITHSPNTTCGCCITLYKTDTMEYSEEPGAAKTDPLAEEIQHYPAYWRPIPSHWTALDYYRVRELFPLPAELQSARLDHAMKKLLVPGIRTGGKSFRKDIAEAYATLGQWLKDNPEG